MCKRGWGEYVVRWYSRVARVRIWLDEVVRKGGRGKR